MKTSIDLKQVLDKVKSNISIVLLAVLLLLLLLQAWQVYRSVSILLTSREVQPNVRTQLVRINFGLFDSITENFKTQASYQPEAVTVNSPFGTVNTAPKRP